MFMRGLLVTEKWMENDMKSLHELAGASFLIHLKRESFPDHRKQFSTIIHSWSHLCRTDRVL